MSAARPDRGNTGHDGGDRDGREADLGAAGFGEGGSDDAGFGGEDELRRLLQTSVADLEPAPDALEQLRRAVPARRQRRRHALVGAAAVLLFGGTAVPAMVHVASFGDAPGDRPANAASSRSADQQDSSGAHGEGTERSGTRPTGGDGRMPGPERPPGKEDKGAATPGADPVPGVGTPAPDTTMDVTSPVCGRDQLGKGTSTVGPADSAGRVYGAFRVVNTSDAACSVQGGGTVDVTAQGTTKADKIHVVDHTSGDDATGLPDPAITPDQLVLKPGQAYEVKFAWIPAAGGGPSGCVSPKPSPTPDPSKAPGESPAAATSASGSGGGTGGQAGGTEGAKDGGAAAGGVVLTHTPEAGEPVAADAKLTDACAGTVYRTDPLAAP
ncbi:hypothetical protein K2224_07775 [Streptomyces sp. BHT-5-2]|uniref:hypothetical protein n=1 Tax=unclassified Streptomyces TaxID=2593676 RepID=UPI001C8D1E8B|nr:hypothetical protein [Streptomyces sp. BHT-5-2]QZL03121.1 hypothetical protein K2224_07775 [Streptomyces sp. BHT-5-2]